MLLQSSNLQHKNTVRKTLDMPTYLLKYGSGRHASTTVWL